VQGEIFLKDWYSILCRNGQSDGWLILQNFQLGVNKKDGHIEIIWMVGVVFSCKAAWDLSMLITEADKEYDGDDHGWVVTT